MNNLKIYYWQLCITVLLYIQIHRKEKRMDKKIVMRVDEQLHKELKTYAFLQNVTMTNYILSLIKKDEDYRKKIIKEKIK